MLGLPKNTEISKPLHKNKFYLKFNMPNKAQESFDADVSRIVLTNEVSVMSTSIAKGETMDGFFVVHVLLKKEDFDEKNISLIAKFLPRKILMVLEFEGKATLAVYETKLIRNNWQPIEDITVNLQGLNFDEVWANIVHTVQGGEWNKEFSLGENLERKFEIEAILKEIEKLERLIKNEKQPKKKFELVQKMKKLECLLREG